MQLDQGEPKGQFKPSVSITAVTTLVMMLVTGADPGFPVGGGANPRGGHQHMILPNFLKNSMKLRKFWAVRGARRRSATE